VVVERGCENLEKPGEGVVRSAHASDRTSGPQTMLDRLCGTAPRPVGPTSTGRAA
jgi:hypothetical protein